MEAAGGAEEMHAWRDLLFHDFLELRIEGPKQLAVLCCHRVLLEAAGIIESLERGDPQSEFSRSIHLCEFFWEQEPACVEFGGGAD